MPTHDDVKTAADFDSFREYWGQMVASLRRSGLQVLDLLPGLSEVPGELDYGHDGSHYGTRASERIALILDEALSR